MAKNYNTQLFDESMLTQLRTLQYSKTLNAKSNKMLTKMVREVRDIISTSPSTMTPSQQKRMISRIDKRIGKFNVELARHMDKELSKFSNAIANREYGNLRRILPGAIGVNKVGREAVKIGMRNADLAGLGNLKQAVNGYAKSISRNTVTAIRLALGNGEGLESILSAFSGRSSSSVRAKARRALEAVSRTASTSASASARALFAKQNEDIIKGIRWVSALDTRTSIICQNLDGKIFPIDGKRPPAHINCRSTVTFVLRNSSKVPNGKKLTRSQRSSMDGPVSGDITYKEWLGDKIRNEPATVIKTFGKARGDRIISAGPSKVGDFVDRHLHPLNLNDIEARELKQMKDFRVERFQSYLVAGTKGITKRRLRPFEQDILKAWYIRSTDFIDDFWAKDWIFAKTKTFGNKVVVSNVDEVGRAVKKAVKSYGESTLKPLVTIMEKASKSDFSGLYKIRIGGSVQELTIDKAFELLERLKAIGLITPKAGQSIIKSVLMKQAHFKKMSGIRKQYDELIEGLDDNEIADYTKLTTGDPKAFLQELIDRLEIKLPKGTSWLKEGELIVKPFRNTVRIFDVTTGKLKKIQFDKRGKTKRYYVKDKSGKKIYLDTKLIKKEMAKVLTPTENIIQTYELLKPELKGMSLREAAMAVNKHLDRSLGINPGDIIKVLSKIIKV